MADLFDLYWSYEPDSNFLNGCKIQSTSKVVAGMPQEKRAIHNCQKISSPGTNWRLPSDYGFTGFMETAVDEIQEDVQITKPEKLEGVRLESATSTDHLARQSEAAIANSPRS
ncbi:hypothetical protein CISG_02643 [Coccidioides immitis RMSCC 3703]|uniref:Uncharacterized protein n=1 Tax=Coccidioides immitis RMSCC 3703 TaxID=454286 RepID=A0A0J8R8P3_COCIT|nr:hypothetical protein CISG_02643 [Coccidioides immitis RMSCC 3703]